MEIDIIYDLLHKCPYWLKPFPVIYAIEYFVDVNQCNGKGDLIVCNKNRSRYLVIELKRSKRKNKKLLYQMIFYRQQFKFKMPHVPIDCAAVADGNLLAYVEDSVLQKNHYDCKNYKFIDTKIYNPNYFHNNSFYNYSVQHNNKWMPRRNFRSLNNKNIVKNLIFNTIIKPVKFF